MLFIWTTSFAQHPKLKRNKGNHIFPVHRAISEKVKEVRRIRCVSVLVVGKKMPLWGLFPLGTPIHNMFSLKNGTVGTAIHSWHSQPGGVNSPDGEQNVNMTN